MILVRRIGVTAGEFIADELYAPTYTDDIENPMPDYLITTPVPNGMRKPIWGGSVWVDIYVRTADDLQAQQEADAKRLATEAKQTGKEYASTGITVPFKSADALAVLQVKAAFEMGVTSTNIKLSNGQVLPMSAPDFTAFATWFATERNEFFV